MSARDRKTPDWKYWQLLGVAKGWEATALSLAIDPRSMTPVASWVSSDVTSFNSNSFLSRQEKDAFYDRLRLLETAFIRMHGDKVSYWNTREVLLAKFAAWCVESGLPVPPEFATLGNQTNVTAESASPVPLDPDATPLPNWKMRIQAEAASRWRAQRKLGCSPTKLALKRELATWCAENNVVTETTGITPGEDYIYRHVLRTWTPPKDH